MARIEASTHIEAPPARVWDVLVDWEGQPAWMKDARSVTVLTPHRQHVGVVLRCCTDIAAGVVINDDMVVTDWDEPRTLAIRHLGFLIRGVGAFELRPTSAGTHFTWWEEIDAPLGAIGEAFLNVAVVGPVEKIFRASLAGLKRVCESSAVRP